MKCILAAAAAVSFGVSAAQAATVDLTYTIEAVVTDYNLATYGFDLEAPGGVGDTENFVFNFAIDPNDPNGDLGTSANDGAATYRNFDPNTGALSFLARPGDDTFIAFNLTSKGGGTFTNPLPGEGQEYRVYPDFPSQVFADIRYDVLEWSVEGLPEIAPVPIPASLPLLALAIGGVSLVSRRRNA